ncbi:tyrosine-type recombinase/integrase [Enterococcus sp. LJL98]
MATFKQYEKKDGSKAWQFQSYLGINPITGKPVKTTRRGFKTKKEAQLELNRLLVDFENEGLKKQKVMTFQELYELWFKQHKKDIKPTTQQRIEIHFKNHILKSFGKLKIDKITPLFCQEQLNDWAESLSTYRHLRTYVRMVFNYGILIDVIKDNPMDRTVTPKKKKKPTDEADSYYTKDELKDFLRCLLQLKDYRSHAFFRLLAFGGLRKGEAMALEWKDIDFEENTITIDKTLAELSNGKPFIQDTKTDSSNRCIKLDNQTMAILKKWQSYIRQEKLRLGIRDNNSTVVFCNSVLTNENPYLSKAYPNNVMKRVKKHFPDMKIIKVHDFRKTNASLLFESGASIKDVSQRLGHKSTKTTTDIYIKVTQEKQDNTAEQFAKYMAF